MTDPLRPGDRGTRTDGISQFVVLPKSPLVPDSTKFDGRMIIETAQDKLLELKARKLNENVIYEWPQDIKYERPQPMSKLRKLSDMGMDCQGGGTRNAKRR